MEQVKPHSVGKPPTSRSNPTQCKKVLPPREQAPPPPHEESPPSPDVLLQEAMIQLMPEVLLALIRDASKLAAAQTMVQFAAHHPMNPPLPSPRRSRELSSAPKEEE
ncbi:UNVERIFIED_CONTAM: hypothetical protein Sangu_2005400 [Sesamum angustifolium]|uniref:Uncharacterized protein n=1 Tax=Sesamum angustifolium TaxID=2727405 RepID=A0AAW2LIS7_9LAMI